MSNNNATKKFSRRKAGNYGRPGSKAQKRTASKSARRFNAISVEDAFYARANEEAQRTFAERKGIDREPSPYPPEDILELIKREKEEEMADEIESLFYNTKFGSDDEFEEAISAA
jgi:hypothetical protein